MLSIVIPARNERFLAQTVEEVLGKSEGLIECIVILDGYWPDPQLPEHPCLRIIHRGVSLGMRAGINAGVAIARGKYILKLDGHCMLDQGYDLKLAADCEKNWVVIPRRKRLDAENWTIQESRKIDVDYEYLSFPNDPGDFGGPGLNGKQWNERSFSRKHVDIDENMSFQGSAWFMHRDYFYELELMDEQNYGPFWNEAQEIGLKCWLSGGKVMTNKKTWYAHLHKGKKYGRGYTMSNAWLTQGAQYTKRWLGPIGSAWHKQTLPIDHLIERFWPIPSWPDDWKKQLYENI
jgi:glycosyltransferase involved in cell wall biosynthesis